MKNHTSYLSIRYMIVCVILFLSTAAGRLQAQGTAFTYQGRLSSATTGVTGLYDFRFAAYDALANGNQVGNTVNVTAVGVTNGLFTVKLDFGANVFNGASRYLDLAAKANGSGAAFVSMTPRQALTPSPYATYAQSAGSVAGSFSGDVTGTQGATVVQSVAGYSGAVLASGAAAANAAGSQNYAGTIVKRDGQGNFAAGNISGSFSGSGAGLTGIPAASITGTISGSQIGANAVGATQLNATSPSSGQVLTYNGSGLAWSYPSGTAGANILTNSVTVGTTAGQLTILGESGVALGISATGGPNPGHVRFRNALEIQPSADRSNPGYLDVRNTNGNATISMDGGSGNISANGNASFGNSVTVNGGGSGNLTLLGEGNAVAIAATGGVVPGHIRLRNALEIQPSADHANAGYLDVRNTNGNTTITMDGGIGTINAGSLTTSADVTTTGGKFAMNSSSGNLTIQGEDGVAVAIGATGGLASGHIRVRNALEIQPSADRANAGYLDVRNTNGNATITLDGSNGNISANNTPGVNFSQVSGIYPDVDNIVIHSDTGAMICSEGNAKPAPGFFIINGFVTGDFQGAKVTLDLMDVSGSTPVVLTSVYEDSSIGTFASSSSRTLNLSWVVPITSANGYQNFGLHVSSFGGDTLIYGHNLTVLFVPRRNN